mmetsp:Transcript_12406/g.35243  ORF Transcript_12406/g.35243 Transcript_12406/m.35243 type:complete len:274 (-) Transcript_12406:265-1086(-)
MGLGCSACPPYARAHKRARTGGLAGRTSGGQLRLAVGHAAHGRACVAARGRGGERQAGVDPSILVDEAAGPKAPPAVEAELVAAPKPGVAVEVDGVLPALGIALPGHVRTQNPVPQWHPALLWLDGRSRAFGRLVPASSDGPGVLVVGGVHPAPALPPVVRQEGRVPGAAPDGGPALQLPHLDRARGLVRRAEDPVDALRPGPLLQDRHEVLPGLRHLSSGRRLDVRLEHAAALQEDAAPLLVHLHAAAVLGRHELDALLHEELVAKRHIVRD